MHAWRCIYITESLPEFINESLHVLQFHLLILHCSAVTFSILDTHLLEGIVVAPVVMQFFIKVMDDLITGHIQELSGV